MPTDSVFMANIFWQIRQCKTVHIKISHLAELWQDSTCVDCLQYIFFFFAIVDGCLFHILAYYSTRKIYWKQLSEQIATCKINRRYSSYCVPPIQIRLAVYFCDWVRFHTLNSYTNIKTSGEIQAGKILL